MNQELLKELGELKNRYEKGENIIQYIRNKYGNDVSRVDSIMTSYDLQAGSYTRIFDSNPERKIRYCEELVSKIEKIDSFNSFLLVGVGEAITLGNVVSILPNRPDQVFGFDISWSRVDYAKKFMERFNIENVILTTGDLFEAPFTDNSIELVMSNHSLEPNGGREEEALKELYRISSKYVVVNEPCYDWASDEAKIRMEKHRYIKNLHKVAAKLGYHIISHERFENPIVSTNPTSCLIIKKEYSGPSNNSQLACPNTKKQLIKQDDCYYCPDSLLAYPIIKGIPCLTNENAMLASSFLN